MEILDAEAAFAEIERLRAQNEAGIVVNIADCLWAGCAADDAYHEDVRQENGIKIFHANYRPGMVDLVLPGDLCICILAPHGGRIGEYLLKRAAEYLQSVGVPARAAWSDFYLDDPETGRTYKAGSYGADYGRQWETTVHFSFGEDMPLLTAFREEAPEMERRGIGRYGVTAEALLAALTPLLGE